MKSALQRTGSAAIVALALAKPAASTASAPVVPWLPLQPAKASASPPLAPPCRAGELAAQLALNGATGSLVGDVELRNAGTTPCALLGHPTISFTGAAARQETWRVRELAASPAPPDVLADPPGSLRSLAPGKAASVALFWSNWCGPGATPTGSPGASPDALTLRLPSGTTLTVPLSKAPRCDAPQDPSTISVGPFTPAERQLPESSRLPLRVTIVGNRPVRVKPGLRAFRVHRGELLRYEVGVANVGAQPFRFASTSCPSYIEQFATEPGQVYVLNCRPVHAIAPGQTVLFEMQLRIPHGARLGNNSLTWQLAPKTYDAPFAPAALWIVP